MRLKLLIVDPNEEWLESAKQYFDECLYETKIISNGKDAQVAVYNEKYFAVILNVNGFSYNCSNNIFVQ